MIGSNAMRDVWTIQLRPMPARRGEAPTERRIAQLLKIAIRAFRLECTSLAATEPRSGNQPAPASSAKQKRASVTANVGGITR